jgi:hypothetical protein
LVRHLSPLVGEQKLCQVPWSLVNLHGSTVFPLE